MPARRDGGLAALRPRSDARPPRVSLRSVLRGVSHDALCGWSGRGGRAAAVPTCPATELGTRHHIARIELIRHELRAHRRSPADFHRFTPDQRVPRTAHTACARPVHSQPPPHARCTSYNPLSAPNGRSADRHIHPHGHRQTHTIDPKRNTFTPDCTPVHAAHPRCVRSRLRAAARGPKSPKTTDLPPPAAHLGRGL